MEERGFRTSPGNAILTIFTVVTDDGHLLEPTLGCSKRLGLAHVVVDASVDHQAVRWIKRYSAQRMVHPWCDDLAVLCRLAGTLVRTPWLLWLEPGEWIDAEELKRLVTMLAGRHHPAVYYLLIRQAQVCQASEPEQCAFLRVMPTTYASKFVGRVRPSILGSVAADGVSIEPFACLIHRDRRMAAREFVSQRARRNIRLADLELQDAGPSASVYNALAEAFVALEMLPDAAAEYRRALRYAEPGTADQLEAAHGLMALPERIVPADERLSVATDVLRSFPLDLPLLCALGLEMSYVGRLDVAVRCFELAYCHGQIRADLWHSPDLRLTAAEGWAMMLARQGRRQAAVDVLRRSLAENPHAARLECRLAELLSA
ncbi:MAG: hypothetical protein KatS3mg110_3060 [Pirellulaceae bacterium]|nr:MAG: hypothetical protein KatS3mg110_3060 [Pirellulaceae bacterium]